jgi:hypothetical protein
MPLTSSHIVKEAIIMDTAYLHYETYAAASVMILTYCIN